jgi:hypothetical protein
MKGRCDLIIQVSRKLVPPAIELKIQQLWPPVLQDRNGSMIPCPCIIRWRYRKMYIAGIGEIASSPFEVITDNQHLLKSGDRLYQLDKTGYHFTESSRPVPLLMREGKLYESL